ncbi:hypothetical protein F2Q69_00028195 [Brassica cretica]|uniref:Uncharacterized protein n=1 Tax=Brassica cretica TaxID=69181 RepID=A0A8S9S2Q9_BRACR|nr:hypothetical protein F2Q69_00028195 [Brassica cretica]
MAEPNRLKLLGESTSGVSDEDLWRQRRIRERGKQMESKLELIFWVWKRFRHRSWRRFRQRSESVPQRNT